MTKETREDLSMALVISGTVLSFMGVPLAFTIAVAPALLVPWVVVMVIALLCFLAAILLRK